MRLKELYNIALKSKEILNEINVQYTKEGIFKACNIERIMEIKEMLLDEPLLKETLSELLIRYEEMTRNRNGETLKEFNHSKALFIKEIDKVIEMCESIGIQGVEEIGIDIKIPINGNFSDFRNYIDDLDFLFTKCPFFQSEDESLVFKNVDIGSVWFTFAVIGTSIVAGGSILLNNITAFIDKCIIIRSHYLTTKKQELDIEKACKSQEQKDRLLENLNEIYKIQIDSVIKELEELTGHKIEDGDEHGRAELCIEKLNKLLENGLEIHASIGSSEETKALFEPLEMKYISVNSQIKSIEQGSDGPDSE